MDNAPQPLTAVSRCPSCGRSRQLLCASVHACVRVCMCSCARARAHARMEARVLTWRIAAAARLSVAPQSPSPTLESISSNSPAAAATASAAAWTHARIAPPAPPSASPPVAADCVRLFSGFFGASGTGAADCCETTAPEWAGQPGACSKTPPCCQCRRQSKGCDLRLSASSPHTSLRTVDSSYCVDTLNPSSHPVALAFLNRPEGLANPRTSAQLLMLHCRSALGRL